ncbi:MAG TPA: hypothetical protein VHZ33_28805 [Trebonia sp.]|jgi:hypothetical protein|nr:hypothetical protein [Trebonia sp.]
MFAGDDATQILAFQRVAGNAHELDALNAQLRKIQARLPATEDDDDLDAPISAAVPSDPAGHRKGDAMHAAPISELDTDDTPRYIRLARLLRGQIEDGTYPLRSLLPSSKRLAPAHAISTTTALHALEMLVTSGHARHIESKPHQVIWHADE